MIFSKQIHLLMALLLSFTGRGYETKTYNNDCEQVRELFELKTSDRLHSPSTVEELRKLVHQAIYEKKRISLVGADKSQGGQTMSSDASSLRISLHKLNQLITLNLRNKEVTVEAGMTWGELEKHIAPHRLAIKAMQSYNDFSIGGSLGVNVHGQDFRFAPLIETVVQFKLLMASGDLVTVSRTENAELFGLAIGGYGLFGVIVEVTLSVTDDTLLEKKTKLIRSKNLAGYFMNRIKNNPKVEFYSARFSVGSSDLLDKALIITYERTQQDAPHLFNLTSPARDSWKRPLLDLTSKWDLIKNWRLFFESLYNKLPETISRNNLLNTSIEMLPQETDDSHYILQEYFIPYDQTNTFIKSFKNIIKHNNINIINLTARHVSKNTESMLSYSPQDMCAFVLYLQIDKTCESYRRVQIWTQQLIQSALRCKGTYYLPYHLLGTQNQLETAYPRFKELIALKRTYDPQELFVNRLYEHYA